MIIQNKTLCLTAVVVFMALPSQAQQSTKVEGQRQDVEVRRGKVVYVSGNDLVVKMSDGAVKHFVIPNDFRFDIDGKSVAARDLQVGTELTQRVTTTTKDATVTSVRNVDAKVVMANGPYLTVSLPDGTRKQVKVPDGTTFNIDGEKKTVFDLRPGMELKGTIVTKTPQTEVAKVTKVIGKAPEPVTTPVLVGVLLIEDFEPVN